ncbi:hypothetical protein SCORR_v1c07280 [Spiroplasma corruscae]|uniref:Uncharacterized protein n=1 Tax=Spiroplasma corruscae TaxID=216934 RepID=A0A222EPP4_9MOLU|nr:hypothetical protein [Spiroplasma corruscae]ASP28500.1 hypothetical protein SCORR_v1c07280 [Spiroplasma corruscae]
MSDKIKVLKIRREGYNGVLEDDEDDKFWFEDDSNVSLTIDFDKTIDVDQLSELNKNNKISLIQNPNSNFFRPIEKTITFSKFDLQKPRYESFSVLDRTIEQKPSRIRQEIIDLRRAAYEQEQMDKDRLLDKLNVNLKLKDNFKNYRLVDSETEVTNKDQSYFDSIAISNTNLDNNIIEKNNANKDNETVIDKTTSLEKLKDLTIEDFKNIKVDNDQRNTTNIDMDEIKNNFSKMKTKLRSDFKKSRFKQYLHSKDYKNNKTSYQEYKKTVAPIYSENMTKDDQEFFVELQKSFGKFYDKISQDDIVNNKESGNKEEVVNEDDFAKKEENLEDNNLSNNIDSQEIINKQEVVNEDNYAKIEENQKDNNLSNNIDSQEVINNEESNNKIIDNDNKYHSVDKNDSHIVDENRNIKQEEILDKESRKEKKLKLKLEKENNRINVADEYDKSLSDTLDDFNKVLNNYNNKQELKEQVKELFERKSADTTQLLSNILQKAKKIKNEDTDKEIIEFSDFESLLDDPKYIKNIVKLTKKEKKNVKKGLKKVKGENY